MEKTIGKRVATGAFAVLVAGTMSFPSLAVALEWGTVGDSRIENGEKASGEGWSYDGADAINLANYTGGHIFTEGDTVVNLEGENTVNGGILTGEGDLTINGDASVPADDRPVLNVTGDRSNATLSTTNDGEGNLAIKGVTVNFEGGGHVSSDGNLTIDNSYLGNPNSNESSELSIHADGDAGITDSVIETDGWIDVDGTLTIDGSDVTVIGNGIMGSPVNQVFSSTNIVLKNMANGEVKKWTSGNAALGDWYYVDTNDGGDVKLRAAGTSDGQAGTNGTPTAGETKGTPAASETKGAPQPQASETADAPKASESTGTTKSGDSADMPKTGDSTGVVAAGASAAALAAMGALALSIRRKHGKHES